MAKEGPRKKVPKELAVINADNCTGCESCLEVCPVDCIYKVPGVDLPMVQYFTYVEITTGDPQNLWVHYEQARAARANMALGRIRDRTDIYPVLRELFAKKDKAAA